MSDPYISPDGRWRWDGKNWVPNTVPPKRPEHPKGLSRKQKFGIFAGIVIGLIVAISIITSAGNGGSSSQTPQAKSEAKSSPAATATHAPAIPAATPKATPKPATPAPPTCQQPCAVASGVTTTVSDVNYGADSGFMKPEAGNTFVTMNVTMTDANQSEAHFNPFNFVLLDGSGIKHTATFTDSCPMFEAVNLTKGASATKCIAFEAAAGKPNGLTLVWSPDLFGGDHNIKLS